MPLMSDDVCCSIDGLAVTALGRRAMKDDAMNISKKLTDNEGIVRKSGSSGEVCLQLAAQDYRVLCCFR